MTVSPRVWRLIAENRIGEAIREGQFDQLPGFGKPLDPSPDTSEHGWLKAKARRESLSLLPPALELARNVQSQLARIGSETEPAEVTRQLHALNRHIDTANRNISWGPPSTTMPVDPYEFLRRRQARPRAPR